MASQFPPKKNTAFNLGLSLYKNDGTFIANPGTVTAKISKDFGDYADIGTVTEEDSTYGQIKLALTNTEMNADVIMIYVVDNTSGCVPFTATIYTAANLLDDIKTDTANNYAILNHADYGNSKLVRSTTPANTLTVDAAHLVAVPTTQKVDLETVKTQAITCAAGVTILAQVGAEGAPGAANGLVTTNGTVVNQTVGLTAGQSIACSDKTGFSLSATGADLILKSSTFIQAIVAAVNEFATYGLTALNTLLVTTGIKVASGTVTTLTNLPAAAATAAELAKVPKSDSNVTWNATALASINAEVVDTLNVDTLSEMAQGAPPASPTMRQVLNYLYRKLRNKQETTATENKVYDDAGTTVLFKETHSDDATTFTKGEYITGA